MKKFFCTLSCDYASAWFTYEGYPHLKHLELLRKELTYTLKYSADQYSSKILEYYETQIKNRPLLKYYSSFSKEDFYEKYNPVLKCVLNRVKSSKLEYPLVSGYHIGIPYVIPLIDNKINSHIPENLSFELDNFINSLFQDFECKQHEKLQLLESLHIKYLESFNGLKAFIKFLLEDSWFSFEFERKVELETDEENGILIVDYQLPNRQEIPNEGVTKEYTWGYFSESKFKKIYEETIYSIVIRTLAETFHYDDKKYISSVCFNGKSIERNPATGQLDTRYILSIMVKREDIESLDMLHIKPKECFKFLKGVSASKLYEITEIKPIITPQFSDKRFIQSRNIDFSNSTNIAEMDWEDFEHLVRQIFEWEFADKGGEVNVTQSSRDGGVDAIVYDLDPIRGGKIIIQAKRYTNTVPVSAVRDLYGTIINEGANKGILITTSDYGPDSYKFAQGKPITLLNGAHLLYLLEKHGHKARIDIKEAKEKFRFSQND